MHKKRDVISGMLILIALALATTGCYQAVRVGALQTESRTIELGDAESVSVDIQFGAGDLEVTGGAENLLDADFTYNVAKLKPEVEYVDGALVVSQPDENGLPALASITDFRNQWTLRLYDGVPMHLSVDAGAGSTNIKLAGLSLTGLDITFGATISTLDLSGDWQHDLDVNIDTGAGSLNVKLPKDVGVRVVVDRGANAIETQGLTQEGNVYTNAAYGVSDVTLQINLKAGIGLINLLEIE